VKRRQFIAGLGSAAAWPVVARGQQAGMLVIGVLNSTSLGGAARRGALAAFRQGLSEAGYVEGRNVAIEYRSSEGQYDRLPALAADLVRRRVSVMAGVGGIPSALAAKSATTLIPIVFEFGVDPIEMGFVASLSWPGGKREVRQSAARKSLDYWPGFHSLGVGCSMIGP